MIAEADFAQDMMLTPMEIERLRVTKERLTEISARLGQAAQNQFVPMRMGYAEFFQSVSAAA